jgi:hypothetical protein
VTVAVVLVLAFSLGGPQVGHAASAARGGPARTAAPGEAGDDSPSGTAPQRLVVEEDKESGPGPALWIGMVMGLSGLVGLFVSLGGRNPRGGSG